MAFDPVPSSIGNGEAVHNADTFRAEIYANTGGVEGVVRAGDLKVQALAVPGGGIRIMPGTAIILNSYSGGDGQSYVGRSGEETVLNIAATGSGAGATRYIIARIDDPQYGGQASGPTGPYFLPEEVATLTGIQYPYIPLARIDQPASTATITNAMITNLRQVAIPKSKTYLRTVAVTSGNEQILDSTATYPSGETWPLAAETAWGFFDIPSWATRARIVMTWAGVDAEPGDVWGYTWVQIGYTVDPNHVYTQATNYDTQNATNRQRLTLVAADDIAIPAALRGGQHKIYAFGNRNSGSQAGVHLEIDAGSSMVLQVEFYEEAE